MLRDWGDGRFSTALRVCSSNSYLRTQWLPGRDFRQELRTDFPISEDGREPPMGSPGQVYGVISGYLDWILQNNFLPPRHSAVLLAVQSTPTIEEPQICLIRTPEVSDW